KTFDAMPNPKLVVAIGDCGHCGGVFKDSYAVIGAVGNVIPVNYIVKGCPPTPTDILSGILLAIT
ncbi:MAG: formate hydrogenlyase, partial [Gammaproteobacteria bacterium CG_4_10_14_0_8_um_filter_38_16]